MKNYSYTTLHMNTSSQYLTAILRKLSKGITQTAAQCNNITPKEGELKCINTNPTAPNLQATIKLHKRNIPIRPIIN
jgi:hypothetical protein